MEIILLHNFECDMYPSIETYFIFHFPAPDRPLYGGSGQTSKWNLYKCSTWQIPSFLLWNIQYLIFPDCWMVKILVFTKHFFYMHQVPRETFRHSGYLQNVCYKNKQKEPQRSMIKGSQYASLISLENPWKRKITFNM